MPEKKEKKPIKKPSKPKAVSEKKTPAKKTVKAVLSKPAAAAKPVVAVKTAPKTAETRPAAPQPSGAVVKPVAAPAKPLSATPAPAAKPVAPAPASKPIVPAPAKPVISAAPPVESKPRIQESQVKAPERPAPAAPKPVEPPAPRVIRMKTPVIIKELADACGMKPADIIARLIKKGIFANINQAINEDNAKAVLAEMGLKFEGLSAEADSAQASPKEARGGEAKDWVWRPPIVTLMGHVDHGKTSLLDAIRKTDKALREHGGITQHIGAYEVFLEKGAVTFLDTPGHEAFTAMRARGAKVTDLVVLVVAADDGLMPQTDEAIDHALAAEATIVVAMNKMDLPGANPDRVKKQLAERGLTPEDWGGKTITVGVSAKTGQGVDQLLDMLLLEAELLELKANPKLPATGVVIEASLSKESGVKATVLIQNGSLKLGDTVLTGNVYGRVRAMINDRGERLKEAGASVPVEILGLNGVPAAGETFRVVENDEKARAIISKRQQEREQERMAGKGAHISLHELYQEIQAGKINTLKLILKADVQGSLEALKATLSTIPNEEVKLQIIHAATGNISESDVMLAAASNAVIMGFHVDIASGLEDMIKREEVDIHVYNIIYELKDAIEKALEGLLEPEVKRQVVGQADVRQVFKLSKSGVVAGCMVTKGKIVRKALVRVMRQGKVVYEGKIGGLKRFKDDVREVQEGYECGLSITDFSGVNVGDRIEAIEEQTVLRTLK